MNIRPGAWMIRPEWLNAEMLSAKTERKISAAEAGIAMIPIMGAMSKDGWYGANTVEIRQAIDQAANDATINGILLVVDSPGGTVSGTKELADSIAAATKKKPVVAYAEDLMASAAYWVASQADAIVAYEMAEVGSIGTVAMVYDQSGAAEKEGVKVHVISTGAHKGAFAAGAPVLPEHLADLAERVNEMNAFFQAAVSTGRGLKGDKLEAVSTGQVWIAGKAKQLGLVDEIGTINTALQITANMIRAEKQKAKSKTALAELENYKREAQSRQALMALEQAKHNLFS